jgi:radical SAM superfamily enzyme YgiQ (UPF0313 family)
MLTLINTNRMRPPIAPLGLDYVACAARDAGIETQVVDLGLAEDPAAALRAHFASHNPRLVGLSLRNVDDSFWPSARSFLPSLKELVGELRRLTDAPLVFGGVGFSIFARRIVEWCGVEYGIRGDGETALPALYRCVTQAAPLEKVPGLIVAPHALPSPRTSGSLCHAPAWEAEGGLVRVPTRRDAIENATYLRLGGQVGLETKRGCPVACDFCADTLAKGAAARLRPPVDVADEAEALLRQGVDVLHLCDGELNVPGEHARAVCDEFIRRGLGEKVRWYAYLAVTPFDADFARAARRAGCVGINFTGPAATDEMLRAYGQRHCVADLENSIHAAQAAGIVVMVDLMLGGPGETPQTVRAAIETLKRSGPECVGAALGVRLYEGLPLTRRLEAEGPLERNPGLWRRYPGPVDLLWPTYYVSPALGERPAAVVREAIGGDARFFEPSDESAAGVTEESKDHNYSGNEPLVRAIADGARGAYWDILRKLRT